MRCWPALLTITLLAAGSGRAFAAEPATEAAVRADMARFVGRFCVDCHNSQDKTAGLALDEISTQAVGAHAEVWEKVVHKLNARMMPPLEAARPQPDEYDAIVARLAASLDDVAAERPNPGRTDTFRRLTRTEYQNAIRDLLALQIDADALLPADESSHGFDNVTVGELSPTLMERYITAAQRISRLAVGGAGRSPGGDTFRVRPDVTQEEHVAGLPLGTRGGVLIPYNFPLDGEYEVRVRLSRDRDEHVEGLREPHELQVLLDRKPVDWFTVRPPRGGDHDSVDAGFNARITVTAGRHDVGVTFLKNPSSLLETKRQPYEAHFNRHRHPRISPAVYQISITGPYLPEGKDSQQGRISPEELAKLRGDTPSRRRIFICRPAKPEEEEDCARRILSALARRAYRRSVTDKDLARPMEFFRQGRAEGDFDAGIELALSSILVNPQFLFRIERDPQGVAPHTAYAVSDIDLASRLSFFLWSSIPDDELLETAVRGELSKPDELERQVRRMLADERSRSLVTNFADQWLYLRNLESITPDLRLFPDFDDNLRQAMRQETEMLFASVMREDRSVLDLLSADYTFLNERLAKHYGIPHVYGERMRRIELGQDSHRGGLLRQGSILTVTSYATRTSPVIRGHWILKNILGTPPPPPPANVPALKDNTVSATLSVRERLAEHRANPACASCHKLMDPVGFSLENFDAVGRWREMEADKSVDAAGGLPDGSQFTGPAGLEQAVLARPEMFVGTMAEKLLTYATGRGVEYYDAPAIRKIVRDAKADDWRFSSLIVGIAASTPFRMRTSE